MPGLQVFLETEEADDQRCGVENTVTAYQF